MERSFALADPVILPGFPSPQAPPNPQAQSQNAGEPQQGISEALGQGQRTITPLHLTAILSAVATDGSAPTPHLLAAKREANAQSWTPVAHADTRRNMLTAATAQGLRQALGQAWTTISGEPAAADTQVGAQIARSQSGASQQVWLYGFVESIAGPAAFVILLEDNFESADLIAIGNDLVAALLERQR
jgi:membrane peptidoglycan carboxypeptidase